jgi:hypothetical protein
MLPPNVAAAAALAAMTVTAQNAKTIGKALKGKLPNTKAKKSKSSGKKKTKKK